MLYRNIKLLIIQGNTFNDEYKLSLIYDMRQFNICGNNETSKFDLYYKYAIKVMEIESAHREHERRHAVGDYDAINMISHDPFIYTNHIIKSTIQILEKDILKQGVDFKVSSTIWMILQFKSNNEQQQTPK